jgi:hypothetical protein
MLAQLVVFLRRARLILIVVLIATGALLDHWKAGPMTAGQTFLFVGGVTAILLQESGVGIGR